MGKVAAFRVSLACLSLALAGCSDPLKICRVCLDTDPKQALTSEQVSRVSLVYTNRTLPDGAANVFYFERCGIDCQQWVRFDAPSEVAERFAASLVRERPMTAGANPYGQNPWDIPEGVDAEVLSLGWWPKYFPEPIVGGENTINSSGTQPLRIVIHKGADRSTVWLEAYST